MPPEPPPDWNLVVENWGPLGLMLLPAIIALYVTVWPAVALLYVSIGAPGSEAAFGQGIAQGVGQLVGAIFLALVAVVAAVAVLVLVVVGALFVWAGGITAWAIWRGDTDSE